MLIGLKGPKGVGKTTLAEELVTKLKARGYDAKRARLADGIKKCCGILFPQAATFFDSAEWKEAQFTYMLKPDTSFFGRLCYLITGTHRRIKTPASARDIMQWFGTEALRDHFGADFWLKLAESSCLGSKVVVYDDVRFDNECRFFRNKGILVHVSRDGIEYSCEHLSEVPVPVSETDITVHMKTGEAAEAAGTLIQDIMSKATTERIEK